MKTKMSTEEKKTKIFLSDRLSFQKSPCINQSGRN